MEDAPAGDHAAGGNDDAGSTQRADLLRLFDGPRQVKFVRVERIPGFFFPGEFNGVILAVAQVEVRGGDGHGAVNVHGETRDALRVFEFTQDVHQRLRAADGKRGDDDGAAAVVDAVDDIGESIERRTARVVAVAVGRFAEQVIGARRSRRVI